MTNQQIKEYAKSEYKKNFGDIFLPVFLFSIISGVITGLSSSLPFIGIAIGVIGGVFAFTVEIGLYEYLIKYIKKEKYKLDDLFSHINDIGKLIPVFLLQTAFIFLYTLLLIIPGIIKAFSYALVPFLYLEDPDKDAQELLKLSEKMMMGHKMEYFKLYLSFLPYHILGILTCGLFEIYVIPLQTLACVKFLTEILDKNKDGIKDAEVIEDNTKNKAE